MAMEAMESGQQVEADSLMEPPLKGFIHTESNHSTMEVV